MPIIQMPGKSLAPACGPTYCQTIYNIPQCWSSFHFKLFGNLESPCGDTFADEIGDYYCGPAERNSTGSPGAIHATGSSVVFDDDFKLWAKSLPPFDNPAMFLMGSGNQVEYPDGSLGPLCVAGGELYRVLPPASTAELTGGFSRMIPTIGSDYTPPILVGSTWNFQAWYRDGHKAKTSNMTNAVSVTFE